MPSTVRGFITLVPVAGMCLVLSEGLLAQQGPVAAMFGSDQKRDASLAQSFVNVDLPPAGGTREPLHLYLSAGDLERAFDNPEFRPDAAIVPTNTDLRIDAATPATQGVLITRVQKQTDVMRELESQLAARRGRRAAGSTEAGVLRIGIDTALFRLGMAGPGGIQGAFPRNVCLIATDYADGGAVDRRELFAQDRMRQGVAACLGELDAAGARSVVMPLMGAGSSKTQSDTAYEGQRTLKECRMINATAALALGIHDFAGRRRALREVGVVQWDQEVVDMFKVPPDSPAARSAQTAYRAYSEQITQAFRRGLSGQKTTASDVQGSCTSILNVR